MLSLGEQIIPELLYPIYTNKKEEDGLQVTPTTYTTCTPKQTHANTHTQ